MPKKQIDLDALVAEDGGEVVLGGVSHRVLPMSTAMFATVRQAHASGDPDQIQQTVTVAIRRVVPSLTAEQVEALTIKQVNAIIDLSLAGATEQDPDPNGTRPAIPASASPA